jgi:hypothetical protein
VNIQLDQSFSAIEAKIRQQEVALEIAIASGQFSRIARAAVELVGFDVDCPLWSHELIVQGKTVGPDPEPGCLTVDGYQQFSAAWL